MKFKASPLFSGFNGRKSEFIAMNQFVLKLFIGQTHEYTVSKCPLYFALQAKGINKTVFQMYNSFL